MQNTVEKKVSSDSTSSTGKETYRHFLKGVSFFSEFDNDALSQVLESAALKKYTKDQLLFLTGDKADFFYVIVNGWVKLFRETRDGHESVISMLAAGDIFGKTAILKKGSFAYTAEAVTNTAILQIPASFMLYMADNHEHFSDFLNKFLESNLNEIDQSFLETEHLAQMTSAERVGCFLLKLCGVQREGSITFQLPYEKSLVAGRLGMTPETFSRSLNQLTSIGVETKNASITIHNIAQLQAHICEHCSAMKKECGLSDDDENEY